MQPEETLPAGNIVSTPSPNVPLPTPSSRLSLVFLGPNGLRAFWRLAIFVAIVFGLRFGISRILHLLHLAKAHPSVNDFSAGRVLVHDGLAFLTVLAATAIMGVFEGRSLADYGLPLRRAFGARFFEGLLWGFVAECATMLSLYFMGYVSFHGLDQRGTSALYFGALWAVAFLMVGLFEESLFRGYPQFTLATGIGFWPAAILLSGVFWWGHMGNPGETWVGGLSTALAALLFCVSLWLTGNLWFAIGMHASWDWAETYFFGVADSGMPANGHLLNTTLTGNKWMTGGTVGPEGSVIELLIVSAVIGLLFIRFRRSVSRPHRELNDEKGEVLPDT